MKRLILLMLVLGGCGEKVEGPTEKQVADTRVVLYEYRLCAVVGQGSRMLLGPMISSVDHKSATPELFDEAVTNVRISRGDGRDWTGRGRLDVKIRPDNGDALLGITLNESEPGLLDVYTTAKGMYPIRAHYQVATPDYAEECEEVQNRLIGDRIKATAIPK